MASSGPNYASSCVDAGGGSNSWTNPGNATVADGSTATAAFTGGTGYLTWTGFGFSIPSGVTIEGIKLEVYGSQTNTFGGAQDVRLLKAGVQVSPGTGNANAFGTSPSTATYGGASDLWGTTWTYSDINDSGFGAAWQGGGSHGVTGAIDYARITVYYTSAAGVTVSVSAINGTGTVAAATEKFDYAFSVSPLSGNGTIVTPSTLRGVTVSASPLSGSGTLPDAAEHFDQAFSVSPLTSSGSIADADTTLDWTESASALASTGILSGASIDAGGSVTVSAGPLVGTGHLSDIQAGPFMSPVTALGGSGVISDGFVVITEANISVGSLTGDGSFGDPGRSVDPLIGNGVISPVTLVHPPNLTLNVLPLVGNGVIADVTVGYATAFQVGPLIGNGVISDVSIATNGNLTIQVSPLIGDGVISPVRTWMNWTGTGLVYSIYGNDGIGGAIDYSMPIDATMGLGWTSPPLDYPGDYKFGQRTSSLVSGLEEKNLDAQIRLILDGAGRDITNVPKAPVALRAFAIVDGGCRAEWAYPFTDRATKPTGFHVYSGPVGMVDYTTIKATVAYSNRGTYAIDLTSGFTDATEYSVGVRAYNATSEESNTDTADFTADASAPPAVATLTAVAV